MAGGEVGTACAVSEGGNPEGEGRSEATVSSAIVQASKTQTSE